MRVTILDRCGFDPLEGNVKDAIKELVANNPYDSLQDHLNGLPRWDGTCRLDKAVVTYLGAEDTPLNRFMFKTMMIAAVRRAFQPGAKFDYMLIFEGEQGIGKSTVVKILGGGDAPQGFYRNQASVNFDEVKSFIEITLGTWFLECDELAGMGTGDIEKLKSILSTTTDTIRLAYREEPEDLPRRCVIIGTTNEVDGRYLRDPTGNRRFWIVKVGVTRPMIDLKGLEKDRDQLFAEAIILEKTYGSLEVPKSLIPEITTVQKSRTVEPEWIEALSVVRGTVIETLEGKIEFISSRDIQERYLRLLPGQINRGTYGKIAAAMRELGWTSHQQRIEKDVLKGYKRPWFDEPPKATTK